ncbi:hypothetical protein ELI02_29820 (plasmid) [Rhizobium leguminosarum]|nr:hypothetical protein ELI32_09645 [Rhizobium leguminosarum]TAV57962.1 hypothetical protein ELI31_09175 [Rhizobium leguminosarum]TAV68903.1 hypothetical protein ELI30_09190 [Rhizobium leguminosarum]TAX45915.1 hypothetical protein ELI02_29820 [Rhizobium leguminosarum]
MRWRQTRIDDTTPTLKKCGCGGEARVVYDATARISCQRCGANVTSDTSPFFRDVATQREHEAWRAAAIWNETRNRSFSR